MRFTVDTTAKTIVLLEGATKEELDKIFKSLNMLGVKKDGVWKVTSDTTVQYAPNYFPPIYPSYPIIVDAPALPGVWSGINANVDSIDNLPFSTPTGNISCVGYIANVDMASIQVQEITPTKSL